MRTSLQRGGARVKLPVMERTVIVIRAGQGAGQCVGQGNSWGAGQCAGQRNGWGIGLAFTQDFARDFATKGARVVVADRQEAAPPAAAVTGGIGQNCEVADPASLDAMAAAVLAPSGAIDVRVSEQACSPACSPRAGAVRCR